MTLSPVAPAIGPHGRGVQHPVLAGAVVAVIRSMDALVARVDRGGILSP